MIVKVPAQRRDGATSFKHLQDYITEGFEAYGADIRMSSFVNLTQYITKQEVLDAMGDLVDKTVAVELGNLSSLQTSAKEMWAVASKHPRCQDPVYHYIISWPEHERPPYDQILEAGRYTLKALGLSEHQYIIAVHANTDNVHAHIEVNRVHPETLRSKHIEWSYRTLHKAARELEIKFGWSHDPGIWEVVEVAGVKTIIKSNTYVDQDLGNVSAKAEKFEVWTGEESFESWCKSEPTTTLKGALDAGEVEGWDDIHRLLGEHGVKLKKVAGGYQVESVPQEADEKPVVVAASRALRFLKPAALEEKFGPFAPPSPDPLPPPTRTAYKRDPVKRFLQKEARREARDDLFARYQEEKNTINNQRLMLKRHLKQTGQSTAAARYKILKDTYTAKRADIKADSTLSGPQKQQAYMLAKLGYAHARDDLKLQLQAERAEVEALLPAALGWRAWVEAQAQLGDQAAISALRGMVYRERRDAKAAGQVDGEDAVQDAGAEKAGTRPSLQSVDRRRHDDPAVHPLKNLTWRVTTNGRIVYSFRDKTPAFIDEGRRVTFVRSEVDDASLAAALEYSKMKWGPTLRMAGGDRIFQERLVRMALKIGLRVDNEELRRLQHNILSAKQSAPAAAAHLSLADLPRPVQKKINEIIAAEPHADVRAAMPDGTVYKGKILHRTETHLFQRLNDGKVIVHDLSALMTIPLSGKKASIQYKDGIGTVTTQRTRGRGR